MAGQRTAALSAGILSVLMLALVLAGAAPARAQQQTGDTGLPLPRFVSLKAGKVNVRAGPTSKHPVKWVFLKSALPVEVVQEFDNWRRIRDSEGEEGWVFHTLLSGRRTGLVEPWAGGQRINMYASADDQARVVAIIAPKRVVTLKECDGTWCEGSIEGVRGFVHQKQLWGVYPDEKFD
ncbi:SH3 domain-containing protein [Segnochrobactraceae bacterium EtOH-i3]